MYLKLLRLGFIIMALAFFASCSSTAPHKKTPLDGTKITEEDITEGKSSQTRPEEQAPSSMNVPPAPPVEGMPPVVDPGSRPPRKFIWRDR